MGVMRKASIWRHTWKDDRLSPWKRQILLSQDTLQISDRWSKWLQSMTVAYALTANQVIALKKSRYLWSNIILLLWPQEWMREILQKHVCLVHEVGIWTWCSKLSSIVLPAIDKLSSEPESSQNKVCRLRTSTTIGCGLFEFYHPSQLYSASHGWYEVRRCVALVQFPNTLHGYTGEYH